MELQLVRHNPHTDVIEPLGDVCYDADEEIGEWLGIEEVRPVRGWSPYGYLVRVLVDHDTGADAITLTYLASSDPRDSLYAPR